MGNKFTTESKRGVARFNTDLDRVSSLITEGKEAEELQEYNESYTKYNEACSILYQLLEDVELPSQIKAETMELAWDLVELSKHQKVYERLLEIANSPREDVLDNAINNNQEVEFGSDCEDDAVNSNFQQMKTDYHSFPKSAHQNQRSMFQLQLAMSKNDVESSDEEEEEEIHEIPSNKFSMINETIKTSIKEAMKETESMDCSKEEEFKALQEVVDKVKIKYQLNSEEGILEDLLRRLMWERDQEKQLQEFQRFKIIQEVRNELSDKSAGKEEESVEDGTSSQVKCKDKSSSNDAEKEARELTKKIERLVKKPSGQRNAHPKFEDVVGLKAVKKLLKTGIQDPIDRPYLVASGIMTPLSGMLLYGPPGTGKSMLAEALANEATQCSFMQITKSDITSKWQGESEKLVSTVFRVAKENAPCIIFIDEVEGLLKDRNQKSGGSTLVPDLLTNMQHLGQQQVFVLAATNNPWDIDAAFLRRFNAVFYVPLPTLYDRITIFQNALKPKAGVTDVEPHQLSQYDFEKLALLTPNYSGGHIRLIVESAQIVRIHRTKNATHFRKSRSFKGKMQPCTPKEPGAKKMSYEDVKNVHYPPITMDDVEKALYFVKAQIDVEHLRKLNEWGRKNSCMVTDL
jgi:vacuolar protein-sorting-associated protein 4